MTLAEKQKCYASLLIQTGLNLQKGQTLVISAPVDCAPFVRLCASAAYAAGAREVVLRWNDDFLTREKLLHAPSDLFDVYPDWQRDFFSCYDAKHAAYLSIYAEDPENLNGVEPDRVLRAAIAAGKANRAHTKRQMKDEIPWCVAGAPTLGWAKKAFHQYDDQKAVDALWEAILYTVRVTDGNDPFADWETHLQTLADTAEKLNQWQFDSLHYQNALGTNLTVGLCPDHIWMGGASVDQNGVRFVANMPTEEIYTAPKRDAVNGVVCASLPLCHNGTLIEHLRFTLKDGKIINAEADSGLDVLRQAIAQDAGAAYLGEVSFVPYDSPISNRGLLFYNTLYDENAACHFAFGEAYPCLKNAAKMSAEELRAAGLNESDTHVDFMVGTADLSITGKTKDGKEIPLMKNGNFVF